MQLLEFIGVIEMLNIDHLILKGEVVKQIKLTPDNYKHLSLDEINAFCNGTGIVTQELGIEDYLKEMESLDYSIWVLSVTPDFEIKLTCEWEENMFTSFMLDEYNGLLIKNHHQL